MYSAFHGRTKTLVACYAGSLLSLCGLVSQPEHGWKAWGQCIMIMVVIYCCIAGIACYAALGGHLFEVKLTRPGDSRPITFLGMSLSISCSFWQDAMMAACDGHEAHFMVGRQLPSYQENGMDCFLLGFSTENKYICWARYTQNALFLGVDGNT